MTSLVSDAHALSTMRHAHLDEERLRSVQDEEEEGDMEYRDAPWFAVLFALTVYVTVYGFLAYLVLSELWRTISWALR